MLAAISGDFTAFTDIWLVILTYQKENIAGVSLGLKKMRAAAIQK